MIPKITPMICTTEATPVFTVFWKVPAEKSFDSDFS